MEIHGKELFITNDGGGIYYDHRLIMSKSQKINEYTDWDYWVERITNNPNFCACLASDLIERSPALVCQNYPCNKKI